MIVGVDFDRRKATEHEVDHSLSSSAEVTNGAVIPPLFYMSS
jgi:hypothetical protein